MSNPHELVDILVPPTFEPSGSTKTRHKAAEDGDWIGTFNVWLYQLQPGPSILYQQRSLKKDWAPGKLDVSAGGNYLAGETGLDGFRELKEELGVEIPAQSARLWGKRLYAGIDTSGRERRNIVSVYTVHYGGELSELRLDENEVEGAFWIPAKSLIDLFEGAIESLEIEGVDVNKKPVSKKIDIDSFPYNPDNYHHRMAEHIVTRFGS